MGNIMQEESFKPLDFNYPQDKTKHIIKVVGVGGGGGNAVRQMFETGVKNVGFVVCNTDSQALAESPVPVKVQLGEEGLGVGGDPAKGRLAAEESKAQIEQMFDDETQMVFVTAGMGGGTGTGASPLIAQVARERGLLTIGVVTLPFLFERKARIEKALCGLEKLKQHVDALLVINNQRLLEIYDDQTTTVEEAFGKANEVLTTATKTIAEIITIKGIVNRDFCDVETVMKNSGAAIVSVGYAEGENRILRAMTNALNSPLINPVDMEKTKRLLYVIYDSKDKPVTVSETTDINQFMDTMSDDLEVLWGQYRDDELGEKVKVAIIATGFDQQTAKPEVKDEDDERMLQTLKDFYYPKLKRTKQHEESLETPKHDDEDIDKSDVEKSPATIPPGDSLSGEDVPRPHSWLKAILDFARRSLEEDEDEV